MDGITRQRMRPWLESKVESGCIPGLEWIFRDKKIFRVPWKHGGKHDWNEADSMIFKEWAIHTGRYREGVDQPDWPTWKTRFRCALNKLPDIQEMKEYNHLDGIEPFRAYRFVDREELSKIKSRTDEVRVVCSLINSTSIGSPNDPTLPDVVKESQTSPQNGLPNFPSDLEDIDVEPIKSDPNNQNGHGIHNQNNQMIYQREFKEEPMDDMECEVTSDQTVPIYTGRGPSLTVQTNSTGRTLEVEPAVHQLQVKLRYCQKEVVDQTIQSRQGCRLFYDPQRLDQKVQDIFKDELCEPYVFQLFGPQGAEEVQFPPCSAPDNFRQETHTNQLLMALDRGLVLESHNGCVYATRKSRCVIFVSTPIENCGQPFKLERNKQVKVFDYMRYFEPSLQRYLRGGEKPMPYFLVSFGQKLQNMALDHSGLLISAVVYHCRSQYRLTNVTCSSPISPNIELSHSDDFDKFLKCVNQPAIIAPIQEHGIL